MEFNRRNFITTAGLASLSIPLLGAESKKGNEIRGSKNNSLKLNNMKTINLALTGASGLPSAQSAGMAVLQGRRPAPPALRGIQQSRRVLRRAWR